MNITVREASNGFVIEHKIGGGYGTDIALDFYEVETRVKQLVEEWVKISKGSK